MTLWITFAIVFVAGPAAFWVLSRQQATRGYLITLWVVTVGFMVVVYGALNFGATLAIPDLYTGLVVVLSFWMAWICMLALLMLAVQRRVVSPAVHRAAFAIGAMATTLPWFGLYAARMVAD
jgi:uncharacterized membrane protein